MTWFRYMMETPDDGAGGGGEAVTDPPAEDPGYVSIFDRPDAWDTPEGEPPADEEEGPPAGAPGAAPPADPTPAAAVQPEGWSDEDWAGFQKQFPNGTPADLWKHYSALRTRFSQGEHLQPQPAADPEPEAAPPGFTHPDYSILGEIPVDGLTKPEIAALEGLMAEDPRAAAFWSLKNSEKLTQDEFDAIQNNWAANDPSAYRRFWAENDARLERERQEAEYGPRMEVVDEQRQREGIAQAEAAVPDITAHKDAFRDWLRERPEIDAHLATITDPEGVKNAVMTAFYQFYGPYRMGMDATEAAEAAERERVAAEEAAAAEAAGVAAQRRGRTAKPGAAAPPAGGEASPEDIREAIRAARH